MTFGQIHLEFNALFSKLLVFIVHSLNVGAGTEHTEHESKVLVFSSQARVQITGSKKLALYKSITKQDDQVTRER